MIGKVASHLLGLVGGVMGAAAGYALFQWLVRQNLYGLMIPGAMLGLGCSLLAQHRSLPRGVVCAVAAIILGLYTEWRFSPFRADDGFRYLVVHCFELKPITQIMIGVGALIAFWLGKDASPLFTFAPIDRNEPPVPPNRNEARTNG